MTEQPSAHPAYVSALMPLQPCLTCGKPANAAYCEAHDPHPARRDDYAPRLLGDAFYAELRQIWAFRRSHDHQERRRSSRVFVIHGGD